MDLIDNLKALHLILDALPVDLFPSNNRKDFFNRLLFNNQEIVLNVGKKNSDEAVAETKKKLEDIGLFVWFERGTKMNQPDFFIVSLKPDRQKHY